MGEINRDDGWLHFSIALALRLLQVTDELCALTGQDPQQMLDAFACDTIGVENGEAGQ